MKNAIGLALVIILAIIVTSCRMTFAPDEYSAEEKELKLASNAGKPDPAALSRLGEIYLLRNDRKRALGFLRMAVKADPDYPPPYFFMGKIHFFDKDNDKGIEEFGIFQKKMDRVYKNDPALEEFYTKSLMYINYLHVTIKRYDDVLAGYKKIVRISPNNQKAHYNLAVCYYNFFHNLPMAYTELQKVIDLNTDRRLSDKARFFIDYVRNNPDSRYVSDFSFLDKD
ncbi:MAG: hypothetical protein HQL30_04420 [Candidatus Omnitrophica bacterium]|nr:hypothetical protein [Candidatus Omnitrophota bacterium]